MASKMPAGRWEECVTRDNWTCQAKMIGFHPEHVCNHLVVHHRRLRSQGGTHDLENLVTLCDNVHRIAHDVDRRGADDYGIILRATATVDSTIRLSPTPVASDRPTTPRTGQPPQPPCPDPF